MFLCQQAIAKKQKFSLFYRALLVLALILASGLMLEALLDQSISDDPWLNALCDLLCLLGLAVIGTLAFMNYVDRALINRQRTEKESEIMLAGLSHDLRTPLTRMRLEIELSAMSEHSKTAIDHDLAQIEHALAQLMNYAKSSRVRPVETINLSTALHNFIQTEKRRWQGLNVSLSTRIAPDVYVRISQQDISRVLMNLVDNALRYGRSDSGQLDLLIRLERTDALAFLEISDRGRGIKPEDTENLIRPFVRGNRQASDSAGAGLGLAIVERLMRRADAELTLISREGGGLTAQICTACYASTANSKTATVAAIPS